MAEEHPPSPKRENDILWLRRLRVKPAMMKGKQKERNPDSGFLSCYKAKPKASMVHHHALVAHRAVALADVEEISAVAVLAQVHVEHQAVGGNGLHQGTHHVVNHHALDAFGALDAHLAVGGVGIDFGRRRNL